MIPELRIMACYVCSCDSGARMAGCDMAVTKSHGAAIRRVGEARCDVVVTKDCGVRAGVVQVCGGCAEVHGLHAEWWPWTRASADGIRSGHGGQTRVGTGLHGQVVIVTTCAKGIVLTESISMF